MTCDIFIFFGVLKLVDLGFLQAEKTTRGAVSECGNCSVRAWCAGRTSMLHYAMNAMHWLNIG